MAAPLTHTCTLELLIDQHPETVTFQVTKLAGWQIVMNEVRAKAVPDEGWVYVNVGVN